MNMINMYGCERKYRRDKNAMSTMIRRREEFEKTGVN
jgi:hypothetical protein